MRVHDYVVGEQNRSIPSVTVIPVLHYVDVIAAEAWLVRAFGFAARLRIGDHRIQMHVGTTGAVVLAQAPDDTAPATLGAGHSLLVRVADADAHCERARGAGATIVGAPTSQPYGERQYSARDLAGHLWTFSQSVADVDPREWGGAPA